MSSAASPAWIGRRRRRWRRDLRWWCCRRPRTGRTGRGKPAIDWTGVPAGTQSFAIAFHDLSNINGQSPFTHWVMWNIPGTSTGLPAELPPGAEPGVPAENPRQVSFRGTGAFAGSGQCGNVYEFVLYALGVPQFNPPDTSSADAVQDALEASNDVLDTATMRGRSNPAGPCD